MMGKAVFNLETKMINYSAIMLAVDIILTIITRSNSLSTF